jgi:hypothetical protein
MKGRNQELIKKRNAKLKVRFDALYNKKRLRYDDVLKKLSEEEFFITENTIEKILKGVQ